MNIIHLTSVHSRFDTRIFLKMCLSLAAHGHSVLLVVADGKSDEQRDGVAIHDVGASNGRFDRIRNIPGRVFVKAIELDADLYHLHDPELIPLGLKLKKFGKRVVFDSHEDVPRQMLGKPYLNKPVRWTIAQAWRVYEAWASKQFDGVIAATPFIRDKFLKINPNTIDINNYPLLGELESPIAWENKQLEVCYVGGLGSIRGIREMVQAFSCVQSSARLNLAGCFHQPDVEEEVKGSPGWKQVNNLGFLDRSGVRDVLGRSVAGLVTLHPILNYIDSQPIKMFEYMSAGIPVIASNFPLWREIIEGHQCGLCVDPLDPRAIAGAIDYLITNPDHARQMGENGKRAVLEKFNWAAEEKKLIRFYQNVLADRDTDR